MIDIPYATPNPTGTAKLAKRSTDLPGDRLDLLEQLISLMQHLRQLILQTRTGLLRIGEGLRDPHDLIRSTNHLHRPSQGGVLLTAPYEI